MKTSSKVIAGAAVLVGTLLLIFGVFLGAITLLEPTGYQNLYKVTHPYMAAGIGLLASGLVMIGIVAIGFVIDKTGPAGDRAPKKPSGDRAPKKPSVVILDDNPLSILLYLQDHPDVTFEATLKEILEDAGTFEPPPPPSPPE